MLKRILCVLFAMLLLISSALAEEESPRLIEAQEGQFAAMQIRSLETDQAVGILGVESEPQQRRWEDFSAVFTRFMKKNWDEDVTFSDAVWSDGQWLHIFDAGSVVMRVYTTDGTDGGLICQALLTGDQMEYAGDVQMLTAAAYWAAAQYGDYGKYTMQIVFMEDHTGDWFTPEPINVWLENGYQLTYGQNEMGCPYGLIRFSEELKTLDGFAPFSPEGMENLQNELTAAAFFQALRECITNGPLQGLVSVPALPETREDVLDGRMYTVEWDDCALLLYTDGEGALLRLVTLSCMSGDTVSACAHLFPLYGAVSGLGADALSLLPCLVGGHGTWEDMSALSPYCVVNGVMLQCERQDIGGHEIPMAYICGAK